MKRRLRRQRGRVKRSRLSEARTLVWKSQNREDRIEAVDAPEEFGRDE